MQCFLEESRAIKGGFREPQDEDGLCLRT